MKKTIMYLAVFAAVLTVYARPDSHCPPFHPPHHVHGRGDPRAYDFWSGFAGGLLGGIVWNSARPIQPVVVQQPNLVVAQPVVIQQPVVAQAQTVWIEGRYAEQIRPDGTVVRVWQPGHYEQRVIIK